MVNAVFSSSLSELSWFTPSFPGFFAHVSSMIWSRSEREISKLAQHSGKYSTLREKHAHPCSQVPPRSEPVDFHPSVQSFTLRCKIGPPFSEFTSSGNR